MNRGKDESRQRCASFIRTKLKEFCTKKRVDWNWHLEIMQINQREVVNINIDCHKGFSF